MFHISGEDNIFINVSSLRLFANLQNMNETQIHFLRPFANLSSFFSRYRCIIGEQHNQDIIKYNNHYELYSSFKNQDAKNTDDLESNANPHWDDDWRYTYTTGLVEMLDDNKRINPMIVAIAPGRAGSILPRSHPITQPFSQ